MDHYLYHQNRIEMRQLFVIVILVWSRCVLAQDIGVQFAKSLTVSVGIGEFCDITDISTNVNGTIFVGGHFTGTVDFDPSPTNSVTRMGVNSDLFLAKYNSLGDLPNSSSVIVAGDAGSQILIDLQVEGQSVYLMAHNDGVASFATGVASSNTIGTNGNIDVIIAKFDEGLTNIWAYTLGGLNQDTGGGLTVDNSGNMYVTGLFRGTVNFDPSGNGVAKSMTAGTDGDMFIAKYNTNGELVWASKVGGSFFDVGADVELDGSGNLLVTGRFNGTVDFDPGNGVSTISSNATNESVFIAKYTSDGNFIWAKSIIDVENVADMSISSTGKIAIAGYYQLNNADVDPGIGEVLLPYVSGLPDSYVAVYDNDGNFIWAKSIGGPNSSLELMSNVYFLDDESVIASGGGGGTIQFNQGETNPVTRTANGSDGFIVKYDPNGAVVYAYMIGGTGADYNTLTTLDEGNLYAYGRIRSPSIDFDPSATGTAIVTSASEDDAYFVKYDITAPKIIGNNTQTPILGTDLLVSIELEDKESAVAGAVLDYRSISSTVNTPFKRVTLTKKSGSTFEGSIPSDDFEDLGLEFRGVATNTLGVVGNTILLTTNFSVPDGFTIPQTGTGNGSQSDYRIISVPLTLNTKTVRGIFEDDLGVLNPNEYRVFSYGDKTTELNANSSLEVGKGYWLIVAGKDRAINTGAGATLQVTKSSPFTLQLNPGWNLIGNPYNFNISWADMQTTNGALTEGLRVFKGSFVNGTQLDAMGGGFVFANDTKTIAFPVVKNTAINGGRNNDQVVANPRAPLQPGDWEVNLNLSQSSASYNLGGLGMRTDAAIDYDSYDEITLPRFVDYLEINHNKTIHGYNYSMDIVPTSLEKTWEFTVESARAGFTTITWDRAALSTLNNQLYLVDVDKQWPIDMTANNEYSFETNGVRHFKAVYGNQEYVKKEITADQFTLYGVYPNPTAGETTLSFSIPVQYVGLTSVGVSLFSVLGQKVADYAYNMGQTGIQEVKLSAEKTSSLTPGIYIVQLQFGDIKKQTRLVIK